MHCAAGAAVMFVQSVHTLHAVRADCLVLLFDSGGPLSYQWRHSHSLVSDIRCQTCLSGDILKLWLGHLSCADSSGILNNLIDAHAHLLGGGGG